MKNALGPIPAQYVTNETLARSQEDVVKVSKRSILQTIGLSLAALATAQIFIACQPNSGGGAQNPAPGTATSAGGSGSPAAGTGDSGGGNGMNNKVFEAYAVDITKTPEWIKHIQPVEEYLATLPANPNFRSLDLLDVVAHSKTWFIAPVTLEQIEKTTLGVAFIKDPVQQFALQTYGSNKESRSVWIDSCLIFPENQPDGCEGRKNSPKKITIEKAERARAYLYLHEALMALYLTRFLSSDEICRTLSDAPQDCAIVVPEMEKGSYEPYRDLMEIDYGNVRSATSWMMNNGREAKSVTDVFNKLVEFGFDTRALRQIPIVQASDINAPPTEVTWSEISKNVADAKTLGHTTDKCYVDSEVMAKKPCNGSIQGIEVSDLGGTSMMLTLKFSIPDSDGKLRSFTARKIAPLGEKLKIARWSRPGVPRESSNHFVFDGLAVPSGATALGKGQELYLVDIYLNSFSAITDVVLTKLRTTEISIFSQDKQTGYVVDKLTVPVGTSADYINILLTTSIPIKGSSINGISNRSETIILDARPK